LAEYCYYDMDQVIASALQLVKAHVSDESWKKKNNWRNKALWTINLC
jgi:hypothetical protein